jgi:predicted regulator of Ras-like GTPase activity (Roadblock/LC7/MglB family)
LTFEQYVSPVRACGGVVITAIADRDGIPVESWGAKRREVEDVVAEFSTFLRELVSANRELQLGRLEQVALHGSESSVLVTAINDNYFLLTVVRRDGEAGKARFASRCAAFQLRRELS